ncbi:MAG: hypothetical protein RIM23_24105 [Coleofasciculus sp. G3-WIS-01]|uniref:hypothetical protein n=1 Tax=Coleofasciculus sp. G3-WIS-01 TaxID=3069528 RepID=UPI0032F9115F
MNLVIPYLKVVSPMVLGCLGQRGFKQPAVKNRPNTNTRKQKAFCPLPSAFWLLVLITPSAVRAQIVPDNTLPVNSQVTGCPVCTIEGGTVRGVNLFHSFQEFGVPTGGEISASTQTGTAGSLSINAGENQVESVSVNNSRLSVEATGEGGKAGGGDDKYRTVKLECAIANFSLQHFRYQ